MSTPTSRTGRLPLPFFALLVLPLAGLLLALWLANDLPGQDRKPKNEEVEEGDEPAKSPPKRSKVPKREEIEDTNTTPDETRPIDLAAEANKADAPTEELFTTLAIPHDEVTMPISGRVDKVEPLRQYIGSRPDFPGKLAMTRIEVNGKRTRLKPVLKEDIKSVSHYEEIALKEVRAFLDKADLPRLQAAEKALIFVIRFHNSKRHKSGADAKPWAGLEAKLRALLLDVRRQQAGALGGVGKWKEAFHRAEQLAKDYPDSVAVQLDLPRLALRRAELSGKLSDYVETRRLLVAFEGQFPHGPEAAEPVRKGLIAKADRLMTDALALVEKDKSAAIEGLRNAARVLPQLPKLQEKLRELDNEHPVVFVGVSSLPRYLSPALAATDSEKQAVELLFESLVKPSAGTRGGWHYEPALAEGRPRVIPRGREFRLARDAFWSDSKRVSAADIRHTVSLLKQPGLTGRDSEWGQLVEDPWVGGSNKFTITLRHGYLEPLALMAFKVLPRQPRGKRLSRADDPKFAENPVGSGPFQFQAREEGEENSAVVFTANPFYQRAGRHGRPWVREIRLVVPRNPAKDFAEGRLHLLLDLPTDRMAKLKEAGLAEKDFRTLANRRVYFLAVNHRIDALGNQDLRKALAHAIDRETLLKDHFRAGYQFVDRDHQLSKRRGPDAQVLHPVLNGPFPAGSWACCPSSRVPTDLYNPALAKSKAKKALTKLNTDAVNLTLKYSNDDPRVEKACKEICAQVARLGVAVKLTPTPLSPREFQEAITKRDYELAYCHHDYASDVYWLFPLFDPDKSARDPGGSNFLQYENDSELVSLFHKAMNHRNFQEVKKLTHDIHAHLYETMPLIPLWQLHSHLAVHPHLQTGTLDPLRVFANVEEWKLDNKEE
jgi:ABC-type oligopeptide transport system substrate-binding subunit